MSTSEHPGHDGCLPAGEPRQRALLRTLLWVTPANLSIAAGSYYLGANLRSALLTPFCIGYLIPLLYWAVTRGYRIRLGQAGSLLVMIAGLLGGFGLAALAGAHNLFADLTLSPQAFWASLTFSVLVSLAISQFFTYYYRARTLAFELEATRRREAESRQAETAAQLAMLQAQIEPHFLFNTLANIQSLTRLDPPRAEHMLDLLNRYLRASLARTRRTRQTLGEELELVRALLGIAAIRLGDRLSHSIEADPALLSCPLPPLLLQPLVENALKHGIEPVVGGGHLSIRAHADARHLVLDVEDNGIGLGDGAPAGVGLANIRQRLDTLYGADARLELSPVEPRGVLARLILPLQENATCPPP